MQASRIATDGHSKVSHRGVATRHSCWSRVYSTKYFAGATTDRSSSAVQPRRACICPEPRALQVAVALAASTLLLVSPTLPAHARLELPNKEVDDSTSPLVQELLKRTEENKERYKKERLQDYYRRNFKEYFEFEAQNAKVARARGLSNESQQAIAKWLEDNK